MKLGSSLTFYSSVPSFDERTFDLSFCQIVQMSFSLLFSLFCELNYKLYELMQNYKIDLTTKNLYLFFKNTDIDDYDSLY